MRRKVLNGVLRPGVGAVFAWPDAVRRFLAGPPLWRDGLSLDVDTQCLLRLMQRVETPLPDVLPATLKASRAHMSEGMQLLAGPSVDLPVRDIVLQGAETALPGRFYAPPGAGDDLLLYFHGGGWVLGDLDSHDALCRWLAVTAGLKVMLVTYRRAPEHPWPAAVLDADQIYREIVRRHREFGVASDRIVLGGDSAGANLATVLARRLLPLDLPQPRAQILIYPVTDCTSVSRSRRLFAEGFVLTRELIDRFLALYIPEGSDARHPDLSPLHAADLTGMPPTLLITAGFDPLRDEGEAYAERLRQAGVDVCLVREEGLVHGFANMLCIEAARRATTAIGRQIATMLAVRHAGQGSR